MATFTLQPEHNGIANGDSERQLRRVFNFVVLLVGVLFVIVHITVTYASTFLSPWPNISSLLAPWATALLAIGASLIAVSVRSIAEEVGPGSVSTRVIARTEATLRSIDLIKGGMDLGVDLLVAEQEEVLPNIRAALKAAHQVDILGITLSHFVVGGASEDVLILLLAEKDRTVRILLLDPRCRRVLALRREQGGGPRDTPESVIETVNTLGQLLLTSASTKRLEDVVRFYDYHPPVSIYRGDGNMYVAIYLFERGSNCPTIKLRNVPKSYFMRFKSHFDKVWESALRMDDVFQKDGHGHWQLSTGGLVPKTEVC